ncbi:MAG: Thiol-disulfide oxidoreductase ResA [bacterium]|nr:Thiol-disulfide oxidoreductase ResA [bacterium]
MRFGAALVGGLFAMAVFWMLTVPQSGETGLGPRVDPASLQPRAALPAIELTLLDGTEVSSASFAGQVTVLHFWGTTCPPCVAETPALRDAWQQELGNMTDLTFIAIASDRDRRTLERFVEARGVTWPVAGSLDDQTVQVWQTLGVRVTPTTVIIDPQGQVRWTGSKLPGNLAEIVRTLATAS